MPKQKGFTLLELMLTIVLVGILASVSAPSFQRWQRDQSFTSDTETFFDTLADARASAVSEKKCEDDPALEWILDADQDGVILSCKKDDGLGTVVEEYSTEWASPAVITMEATDSLGGAWTTEDPLRVVIFAGGTQSIISDSYVYKWAKVSINFEDIGKEKTICYSRIANYPYYSPNGSCSDEI